MLIYFLILTDIFFFQTATENLLCCSTSSTMPSKTSQQDSVEKFWNLQRSKFVNHNGAKMVDVWNVSKLTEANEVGPNVKKTNTDFGISIWNMKYGIRNMSVLIPCQQPPFSDITINFWITKTASARSSNPEQNIWNKIEKSRKTGQNKKSLISICACFLTAIVKFNFWKGDWAMGYSPSKFGIFLIISFFPRSLSLK